MAARPGASIRERLDALLRAELAGLGRQGLQYVLCLSDASWRAAMASLGCPAYAARLASPTARRGTRGKLGMATVCHARHGHAAVVYIRTRGRDWQAIAETARHEAMHLARPSYSHRRIDAALGRATSLKTGARHPAGQIRNGRAQA